MSYSNPEWSITSAFNIFGEGTFRFFDYETFDWTGNGQTLEKLTNEGWIIVGPGESSRVLNKHIFNKRIILKNMKYKNDLEGKVVLVKGIVEEHLIYNNKEWVKIRFPDNSTIVINKKLCEIKQ